VARRDDLARVAELRVVRPDESGTEGEEVMSAKIIELRHESKRHRIMLDRISQPDERAQREFRWLVAGACILGAAILAWAGLS
jgi:hypothetical protein